jgi:hypothetical protein
MFFTFNLSIEPREDIDLISTTGVPDPDEGFGRMNIVVG